MLTTLWTANVLNKTKEVEWPLTRSLSGRIVRGTAHAGQWLVHCCDKTVPTLPKALVKVFRRVCNEQILGPLAQRKGDSPNLVYWNRMHHVRRVSAVVRRGFEPVLVVLGQELLVRSLYHDTDVWAGVGKTSIR